MNSSETITNNILYDLLKDFKNDVNRRFDEMERRFDLVDHRFEQVDKRFEQVDQRFAQVDQRFAQVDKRFEQVDQRFEKVDQRFEKLANRMTNNESKQNTDHEILLDLQKHKGKLKITYSKHLIIANAGIAGLTALLISTAFNLLT